jgi:hypothetical protein
MKKFLEKLGIYTKSDLIGTIGGFAVLALVIEILAFVWVDSSWDLFLIKLGVTTILVILLCSLLDN